MPLRLVRATDTADGGSTVEIVSFDNPGGEGELTGSGNIALHNGGATATDSPRHRRHGGRIAEKNTQTFRLIYECSRFGLNSDGGEQYEDPPSGKQTSVYRAE